MRSFSRSTVTSLFTTALDFLTLIVMVEVLGLSYVVGTWAGTVVGSLSNFSINKHWSFEAGRSPVGPQMGRFLLVQAGASGLHTLGVWLLTRFLHVPYLGSKTIVAVVVFLAWNYPLNRVFVFPAQRPATGAAAPPP
jgi:putative flippase GtrA